ncbi:unnamed protein product [Ostreobium quekettii]|uniref:Uncharacterized protein n=1 Tax=Ostreobium quekettii TaxID=121088 RepID=A0A8S1JFL1_9CHLO|nr:unnamed protein product [Ostreobium quekettii]
MALRRQKCSCVFGSSLPRLAHLPNARTLRVGHSFFHGQPCPQTNSNFAEMPDADNDDEAAMSSPRVTHLLSTAAFTPEPRPFSWLFRRMHRSNPRDHIRVQLDLHNTRRLC